MQTEGYRIASEGSGFQLVSDEELTKLLAGFREFLPLTDHVEASLRGVLADTLSHPGSLVRSQLAWIIMRDLDIDSRSALAIAVAIEYFHTASLLFDDLPSMDNATERRGRVCPHLLFGEAAATLGALGLINRAYALVWRVAGEARPEQRERMTALVEDCLGVNGILNGQSFDLQFADAEGTAEDVERAAEGKTVSLIRLTLMLPAIAGGADVFILDRLDDLARAWGLAYQIIDDFKDCLLTPAETGKTTSRDSLLHRPNLPMATGFGGAYDRLEALLEDGRSSVDEITADGRFAELRRLQSVLDEEMEALRDQALVPEVACG